MQTTKSFFTRVGRTFTLLVVVILSIVAGLFLMACKRVHPEQPWPPPDKPSQSLVKTPEGVKTMDAKKLLGTPKAEVPPQHKGSSATGKKATAKKKKVDVKETERGQPIPRNMLE